MRAIPGRLLRPRSLAVLAALIVLAGVGALLGVQAAGGDDAAAAAVVATGTTTVQKRDLVLTDTVSGQLGYDHEVTLATFRAGVVTSAAEEARTVRQGKVLYAVDREPTVLLSGKVPAYRSLSNGRNGRDVRQLEQALVSLGYGSDITVDRHFTAATAAAVEDWERDLGRADPDGKVELGDVVFADHPMRVLEQSAAPGSQVQSGSAVLQVASTTKIITLDLDADRAADVSLKDAVSVELPDGVTSSGRVSSIGTRATSDPSDPGAAPTVPVVITLSDPGKAKAFDSGSADVDIETSRDDGVLTVPVGALLALAEGGYAVQSQDGSNQLIGVDVGTISDSYAEISGAGIVAGLTVVVPA